MAKKNYITLTQHIVEQEKKRPEAIGELSRFLSDISLAAKVIFLELNKIGLVDILGFTGKYNIHGEKVKKLDLFAHNTLIKIMNRSGHFCAMVSEEEENIIHLSTNNKSSNYVLFFDPLDGSSNIDVNISIGTIFSIYKRITPNGRPGTIEDCLQQGIYQIAAGYILYGLTTILVYTTGEGVYGFTLDHSFGEFLLSHENIKIPKKSSTYSINEGNYILWNPGLKKYINFLQEEDSNSNRPYSLRYVASLVADIHRSLLYGGIFIYPSDSRYPSGKLRLMYECNPMAMIIEAAGGRATNGKQRIMEIMPTSLHEQSPLFIGSEEDVRMVEKFLSEEKIKESGKIFV